MQPFLFLSHSEYGADVRNGQVVCAVATVVVRHHRRRRRRGGISYAVARLCGNPFVHCLCLLAMQWLYPATPPHPTPPSCVLWVRTDSMGRARWGVWPGQCCGKARGGGCVAHTINCNAIAGPCGPRPNNLSQDPTHTQPATLIFMFCAISLAMLWLDPATLPLHIFPCFLWAIPHTPYTPTNTQLHMIPIMKSKSIVSTFNMSFPHSTSQFETHAGLTC